MPSREWEVRNGLFYARCGWVPVDPEVDDGQ